MRMRNKVHQGRDFNEPDRQWRQPRVWIISATPSPSMRGASPQPNKASSRHNSSKPIFQSRKASNAIPRTSRRLCNFFIPRMPGSSVHKLRLVFRLATAIHGVALGSTPGLAFRSGIPRATDVLCVLPSCCSSEYGWSDGTDGVVEYWRDVVLGFMRGRHGTGHEG